MKTKILSIISVIILGVYGISCERIDGLQDDPNRVSNVTPDLLLTNIEIDASKTISTSAALASRQLTFTDGMNDEQYYNWQRSNFDNYYKLKQVQKLEEEAERHNQEVYKIISKFFYSYYIINTTMTFGDVPYSESLKVNSGVTQPKYDTQKEIFQKVLDDLLLASDALADNDQEIKGDIIYKGNKLKWRKLINSFYLKTLLNLSVKINDTDLKIQERFQNIVHNPSKYPIFETLDDSAFLYFVDSKENQYPYFNNNSMQTAFYMEESFVNKLINLEDPRLFRFAALKNKREDDTIENFNNYGGLKGSNTMNDNVRKAVEGEASRINPRYYLDPINEPSVLMSYWELNFILAEAVERGWIAGDLNKYYENAIKSSFEFLKADIPSDYLDKNGVMLDGVNNIELILTQKHTAFFMNSDWQQFYDNRRTGFPDFNVDGGGVLNQGRIPKKWMYPTSEIINNISNLSEAIERQFSEGDNINAEMWILKNN